MDHSRDIPDAEARARLQTEARQVVRHIRAHTVTYDTEDFATAAVMALVAKREFQLMRHLGKLFGTKIVEYPQDDEHWANHLLAELAEACASLMDSYGEVEGR